MQILRATAADFDTVQALMTEYYESIGVVATDAPSTILHYLTDANCGVWLALMDGVAFGCVALRPLPSIEGAWECKRLYVKPAFRGRGAAQALMDALETAAAAMHVNAIYLDSTDKLEAAIALYRGRGYVECARYNDNPQATIFMRKPLHF